MAANSSHVRQLLDAALQLPAEDRAHLADALQASIEQDPAEREAWLQMARKAFDEGKAQIARGEYDTRPIQELFDELDEELGVPPRP